MPHALGGSGRCVAVDRRGRRSRQEEWKSGQAWPHCGHAGCVQVHDSDYVSVYDYVQVHVQVHVHRDVTNREPLPRHPLRSLCAAESRERSHQIGSGLAGAAVQTSDVAASNARAATPRPDVTGAG